MQLSFLEDTESTDWSLSSSTTQPSTEYIASLLHSIAPLSTASVSGTGAATMENVEIFNTAEKGRGLKATKEFWAGDVIFSEPGLSAVVFDRYSADTGAQWWGMGSEMVITGEICAFELF